MEQKEPTVDSQAEGNEGRLKELASKWFINTQVPHIIRNGFFPTWFVGFITRKDAEEILREKELGCFLIRLSDKAIGYILSYKGRDRCRHFMINQSESGQFVVYGDTEGFNTVSDLIECYKTNPIQPFGEYLTSSCFEALNEELYDIIQFIPKNNPGVSGGAVKNRRRPEMNSQSKQPPARPPKGSKTPQEAPPLPRRSRQLDIGPVSDQDGVLYAHLMKQSPRNMPRHQHIGQESLSGERQGKADRSTTLDQYARRSSPPSGPVTVYTELSLLDGRSRSLPFLGSGAGVEQSSRLSTPPHTPPRLSPKPLREATSTSSRPSSSHSLEYVSDSAIYHLAGRPGSPHTTPAEVSSNALTGHVPDTNTYELIPGQGARPDSNTYEPLEDVRPKNNHSSWHLKNDKWKWLVPEVKKKW
ncbi:uncharacterized protein V6R79_004036 [Siganus canaliculatus]